MKLQTIRKRLQLTSVPEKAIDIMHTMMQGIPDKDTVLGGKHSSVWTAAMAFIFTRFSMFD